MKKIEFEKREERAEFLDQREGYSRKSIPFEIRKDPLTGHISRILPFRRRLLETVLSLETIEASKKGCPFCPEQIESLTPKFVPEIAVEGRIRKGKATSFPNSFPYARHNWVVVLSEEHFYHLQQFTVEILRDGFLDGPGGDPEGGKERSRLHLWLNQLELPPSIRGGIVSSPSSGCSRSSSDRLSGQGNRMSQ